MNHRALRRFRGSIAVAVLMCAAVAGGGVAAGARKAAAPPSISGLLALGRAERWDTLTVGETVARFGRALEGAPYLEKTLEAPGPEVCRVTTRGFDCVTFMETALNLARVLRADHGGRAPTEQDVRDAVTWTRYRGGRLDGYLSRLHYTAEWIADNEAKGVLEDVTPALGGERYPVDTRFMSEHPALYPALRADPTAVAALRQIERRIRSVARTYVPKDRVAEIENRLRTGDLVAITTSVAGLDYAHTGLIVREGERARLLHASSRQKHVVLDEPLADYLAKSPPSHTGISVLRPLDPGGTGR